jgi:hypothetical protein
MDKVIGLRGKSPTSFCSAFMISVLIVSVLCSVQGFQVTQTKTQTQQLVPPPPSAPHWTYKFDHLAGRAAVSEDGSTIVDISHCKIYVFSRQSNSTIWTYEVPSSILSVAISANGSTIVVCTGGGLDNRVLVFGRQSNMTIWTYKAGSSVLSVDVSADGNTIVAGSISHGIHVFSRQNNATIRVYYVDRSCWVSVSADGSTIVGQGDDSIYVFGEEANTTMWTYTCGESLLNVAVSASGNTIVAGCRESLFDNYFRVFGRSNNATLWSYGSGSNEFCGVAVSSDGATIGASCLDHHVRVFGRASNATLVDYDAGAAITYAFALSSDASTIAWAYSKGLFSYSKGFGLLWSYSLVTVAVFPMVWVSGDGSLTVCSNDYTIRVFDYDVTPPVLGTPGVSPSSPVGGQHVDISVSVTDNVAVSTVALHYWNSSSGSWSCAEMSLTGVAYNASMGPFSSGDVISYYVTAEDSSGNTAGSPANAPLSYYTIMVGTPQPPSGGESVPAGIESTSVLLGAGLGAAIAIIIFFALLWEKKRRR